MPNRGHTTIEMSSPRGRAERHAPHENPRVHAAPINISDQRSRTPSPNSDRRHHHNANHHDSNHLTASNSHHLNIESNNGHSMPNHDRNHHSNNSHRSHENLAPNDHHAPEDSTPLLHRTRREAVEPSDNKAETSIIIPSDALRPPPGLTINIDAANNKNQPLKEPDVSSPKPPIAGPEVDDLDDESDIPNTAEAHPGVDDGFFPTDEHSKPDGGNQTEDEGHNHLNPEDPFFTPWDDKHGQGDNKDESDGLMPGDPRLTPRFGSEAPFPYAPEFSPGAVPPVITPDVNVYQQKKNLAQGMMDLALLSANANQLRYVLEAGDYHPYYYPSLVFISFSLILQIGVGVGLIMNSTYNIKDRYDICKADKINNFTVIGIFLITVVNVFIASFGVAQLPQPNGSSGPNN